MIHSASNDRELPARGDDVIRLVSRLPRLIPELRSVTLTTYKPRRGLAERLSDRADAQTRAVLKDIRIALRSARRSLDGVEALAWSYLAKDNLGAVLEELIPLAVAPENSASFRIDIADLTEDSLRCRVADLPDETALAICSGCTLIDGRSGHIPMMDFRALVSGANEQFVADALHALGHDTGFILASGNSYHSYGTRILDDSAWREFMAMALLLAPFTDTRYIAHRLRAGMCTLRLNSTAEKQSVPVIVRSVGIYRD